MDLEIDESYSKLVILTPLYIEEMDDGLSEFIPPILGAPFKEKQPDFVVKMIKVKTLLNEWINEEAIWLQLVRNKPEEIGELCCNLFDTLVCIDASENVSNF